MSERKPKIMAKDLEEFKKLSDKISELPECIVSQIETVEEGFGGLLGLKCKLRDPFTEDVRIFLPNYTTQIKDFGEYIGIYSENFFFEIHGHMKTKRLEYVFIECKKT